MKKRQCYKLTDDIFKKRATIIHHGIYDYKLVNYINSYTKVKIVCLSHGAFKQTPSNHLNGNGCFKCANELRIKKRRKIERDNFFLKAPIVHNNKYDYSKSQHINKNTKIIIICPKHGHFKQTPGAHIKGQACPKCSRENMVLLVKQNKSKSFFEKAPKIHDNKYSYLKVNYINCYTNVTILCKEHGYYEQTPSNHLAGRGCLICARIELTKKTETFINDANTVHNNIYNYDKSVYENSKNKIIITCLKHGDFLQVPNRHLAGNGCPKCKLRIGEKTIFYFLDKNNIKYVFQKKFDDCKDKKKMPFDFYLPDYNICIEYNGRQHYMLIDFFGGAEAFETLKKHDLIKSNFCRDNDIKLIVIKYDQDITQVLTEALGLKAECLEIIKTIDSKEIK